jgi:two-component system OmpR family response regulator
MASRFLYNERMGEKKVLLIDDNKDILLSVTIALAGRGYEIFYANSAEAGLQKLRDGLPIDLIILDIMMPNDSGIRCLERLREMKVATPVLVYSALTDWRPCRASLKKGAHDYLAKSVLNDEFVAVVNRLIYGEQGG